MKQYVLLQKINYVLISKTLHENTKHLVSCPARKSKLILNIENVQSFQFRLSISNIK